MFSLIFVNTRSVMVAEVSVTLVGMSITVTDQFGIVEQRKLSFSERGSNETLLTSN